MFIRLFERKEAIYAFLDHNSPELRPYRLVLCDYGVYVCGPNLV